MCLVYNAEQKYKDLLNSLDLLFFRSFSMNFFFRSRFIIGRLVAVDEVPFLHRRRGNAGVSFSLFRNRYWLALCRILFLITIRENAHCLEM